MTARIVAHVALACLAVVALAFATDDDPCAGHQTPDGITADAMGPCDELPGVA